jgi:hypothetical protein
MWRLWAEERAWNFKHMTQRVSRIPQDSEASTENKLPSSWIKCRILLIKEWVVVGWIVASTLSI